MVITVFVKCIKDVNAMLLNSFEAWRERGNCDWGVPMAGRAKTTKVSPIGLLARPEASWSA
jgi:hypothetical protein